MKPASKGVILSGLVYPGIGQIFLGRKYSGLGIMIVSTIALIVLIYRIAVRFYLSIDPLLDLLTTKSLTFESFKMVLNQSGSVSWKVELISLAVFVFCVFLSAFFVTLRFFVTVFPRFTTSVVQLTSPSCTGLK